MMDGHELSTVIVAHVPQDLVHGFLPVFVTIADPLSMSTLQDTDIQIYSETIVRKERYAAHSRSTYCCIFYQDYELDTTHPKLYNCDNRASRKIRSSLYGTA